MREETAETEERRTLGRALVHIRGCLEAGEVSRLGTVHESLQPVVDAALSYASRRADQERARIMGQVAHIQHCLDTDNRRYMNEGLGSTPELADLVQSFDRYVNRRREEAASATDKATP